MNGKLDPAFWQGKRVFVTGHTGFKGSWLTIWLKRLGARVAGYALAPHTDPAMFDMLRIDIGIDHILGDIRDGTALTQALTIFDPDVVIHMAAQPIVSEGYSSPVVTFDTNIMGTVHLLEACRKLKREIPVVVISSDKCYLNDDKNRAFSASDSLGGRDPYSASKAGTELVANAYRASYFSAEGTPRIASARAGNVIGGGDYSENRLLADGARAFARAEPFMLRNPTATRPWQHVLEPLYGYLVLAQSLVTNRLFATPWNFGPDANGTRNVREVAETFAKAWQGDCRVQIAGELQDWHEAKTLGLDCSETVSSLGWKPALELETALEWTAQWYSDATKGKTSKEITYLTLSQIECYEDLQTNNT